MRLSLALSVRMLARQEQGRNRVSGRASTGIKTSPV
jgi:hypothetical protein